MLSTHLEVGRRLSGLELDDEVVGPFGGRDPVLAQVSGDPGRPATGRVGRLKADHDHILAADVHQLHNQLDEGLLVAGHEVVWAQPEAEQNTEYLEQGAHKKFP